MSGPVNFNAGFRSMHRDKLPRSAFQERVQDTYKTKGKLPEPTVCPQCGAVYHKGRWQWLPEPEKPHEQLLPGVPSRPRPASGRICHARGRVPRAASRRNPAPCPQPRGEGEGRASAGAHYRHRRSRRGRDGDDHRHPSRARHRRSAGTRLPGQARIPLQRFRKPVARALGARRGEILTARGLTGLPLATP